MRKVIERQNPIEVWGDGTDERDVLYVSDMVDAMVVAAEKVEKFDQINIGYGSTYTVFQILDAIKKAANYEAPYKLIPTGPRMIPVRRVNIDKAEKVLGWKPKVSFEDGIARTYEWTSRKLSQE
jgi:nucleoside-diphosphate-sugar epimerase